MSSKEPELVFIDNFIENSSALFVSLWDNIVWDERIKARKTASFGVAYDYSNITYPQVEMLPDLIPICHKIAANVGFLPNNCLLNYYPDGNSTMGYHSDSAKELKLGTGVVIISLGCERYIYFRSKADKEIKFQYLLCPGKLLYMDKAVQDNWMHAIPKQNGAGERISLSFRCIV
ncbi:alkylated DNA repair protein [Rivularia sp. PCC 7116]|uniref:alpha-ketoglutarate-dependent dioxygenase AlkB n=1 Tax=Rivularia sp. PCC 7116 TaxID=373994 RepID=UPI00029F42C1|nr:alpha-ketoglutarate-dependent dioxygenase AlkB [Rivularia sp. PCC 7116]AFY56378.1 alkylated DNA repair protein [Rivularia sp. PCC 7116]